jgi:hypothetical protein
MRRREFVRFLGAAAASACPLIARAQQPGGTRRLGILMSVQDDPEGKAQLSGFTQALAGLGWIEGRNLQTQIRWGGGDARVAQMHAKELVGLKPDVILSQGTPVTAALKRETQSIPIVFVVPFSPACCLGASTVGWSRPIHANAVVGCIAVVVAPRISGRLRMRPRSWSVRQRICIWRYCSHYGRASGKAISCACRGTVMTERTSGCGRRKPAPALSSPLASR